MSENVKHYSTVCSKIGFALLIFYAAFTLSMFGVVFLVELMKEFISALTAEILYEILSSIAYFLSFSGAAFILCRIVKEVPTAQPIYTTFKINSYVIYLIFAVIAINFTLAFLNNIMISSLSPGFASDVDSGADMEGRPVTEIVIFFILSTISTAIVPAICEEYLFRGAILTNLLPFGKTTAILGSALLFGLMHQNLFQLLYTTLMGVIIGCLYVKTKSIWACMILHFMNNFTTVLEEYLPLLTGVEWLHVALDFIIIIVGAISVLLILIKKDKEPSVEENGSFGVVYERGMDVEECELGLTQAQKAKKFFAATIIIYSAICLFEMAQMLLSLFDISIVI